MRNKKGLYLVSLALLIARTVLVEEKGHKFTTPETDP